MKNILVIGSLNMDMVVDMERLPDRGETVSGYGMRYAAGGKGANQAAAAGRLGENAAMLGCIGRDAFGERLAESLKENGVDISRVRTCPDRQTGMAVIQVDGGGGNTIVVIGGANESCGVRYIEENADRIGESDIVIFQMEIPLEAIRRGMQIAGEKGKTVILNPAPAPDPALLPADFWKSVSYATPNETELARLTGIRGDGIEELECGCRRLLGMGAGAVVVTLGARGAFYMDPTERFLMPAVPAGRAVDTTAAGDCFNAAFAVALSEGRSVREAVLFANCASGISVTRAGAQPSLPARGEADAQYVRAAAKLWEA